jgi:trk system potassium uptake protein TrkH
MSDTVPRRIRRPGDKVVRRRVDAQQVMELPPPPTRREPPTIQGNAKRFALAYAVFVLLGAGLLSTPLTTERGEGTPFVDALFTAVSATAVTGLVTIDTQDHWNFFGEAVILLLIQAGGLGFMVGASLVLLTLRRSSSLRGALIMRDGAPTISLQEARQLSGRILRFMLIVEAIGAVILAISIYPDSDDLPQALWWGLFHSVSAFCNAGFDLQGEFASLYGIHNELFVDIAIMSLIQLGALSFIFFADLWDKREHLLPGRMNLRRFWQRLSLDSKLILVTNYTLVLGGAVAFAIVEWDSALAYMDDPVHRVMGSLFQSVSARTAGFATINFGDAQAGTLFLWIGLMMIGGASASTAGGVKLATFAVVVLTILSTLRGRPEPQYAGRRIASPLVYRAMTIIALFMMAHFLLTLLLVLTEDALGANDFTFLALMFETMSGLATVGVSTGITPDLTTAGKLVLCLTMFVGRLGPLTAAYALQRREHRQTYTYPEAYVRMG